MAKGKSSFLGNETAKFKFKGGVTSQHGSPDKALKYDKMSDIVNLSRTPDQMFDSTSQGFPYMKKKHLHKAIDIQ